MMMKKIFSILSLVLMFVCCNFALISCGDDDDDENNVNTPLVGTWELYDPQNPNSNEGAFAIVMSLTFNADGTFLRSMRNINYQGTDLEGYFFKQKGTYTVSNDKLTLNGEQAYKPAAAEDPISAQWEEEKWTVTYTIEWLEGNTLMRLHSNEDGPNTVNTWKKKK